MLIRSQNKKILIDMSNLKMPTIIMKQHEVMCSRCQGRRIECYGVDT